METVIPTEADKAVWSRAAIKSYASGNNFEGHRLSAHAGWPKNHPMLEGMFWTLNQTAKRYL